MRKIRAVGVLQNKLIKEVNTTLDNKIAAAALMSKPGWSAAPVFKTSLPDAISVGPYATGEIHAGFRGIYATPATRVNIAANRLWEQLYTDISFKRFDQVGRCEIVEVLKFPTINDTGRIKSLLYNIYTTFGNFEDFSATNIEFFIGSNHATKALLKDDLEKVNTQWDRLTGAEIDFYEKSLGFDQKVWNTLFGNAWNLIVNLLCGGDDSLIKHQTFAAPA